MFTIHSLSAKKEQWPLLAAIFVCKTIHYDVSRVRYKSWISGKPQRISGIMWSFWDFIKQITLKSGRYVVGNLVSLLNCWFRALGSVALVWNWAQIKRASGRHSSLKYSVSMKLRGSPGQKYTSGWWSKMAKIDKIFFFCEVPLV